MEVVYELHRTEIYEYEELDCDGKSKVKEWFSNSGITNDSFNYDVAEDMSVFGRFHDLDYQYSLSYCQGDGFNIYGKVYVENILECLKNWPNVLELLQLEGKVFQYTDKEWGALKFYESCLYDMPELQYNHRYSYCTSEWTDFATDWIWELREYHNIGGIRKSLIRQYEKDIIVFFGRLCGYYEKRGYQQIYEPDEEWVAEICDINEWRFTKEGKLV